MARFLLIHGAAHGAWCWRDVLPGLTAMGHEADALDLPSHGSDPAAPGDVTLDDYADAILAALAPDTILVGHSMAGFPITLAAERAPAHIRALVYLTAYLPRPGMALSDMRTLIHENPMAGAVQVAPDRRTMTYDPDQVEARFYQDCPPGTLEFALPRLTRQPMAPMLTPVVLKRSPSLPRHYILCTRDQAILPELQEKMAADLPPGHVHQLDTGHSPFFADPATLARTLNNIAEAP